MPYNCEDCGELGARMNTLFEIRLCSNCLNSPKYKLICKSKVLNLYKLTEKDLNDYENPPKEYLVKNPHYSSSSPMILYQQKQIEQVFLWKYEELIKELSIQEPLANIEETSYKIEEYKEEKKQLKKQENYRKTLNKYNIESEEDLPMWILNKLYNVKSKAEYERTIIGYLRFKQLYKLMKQEKLIKYVDHKICHDFIYQKDKSLKLEQIPNIIRFMLNKKSLIAQAVKINKIDKNKYADLISEYINSFEPNQLYPKITNDVELLVDYIINKENNEKQINLKTNELVNKLKSRGLELRSDSVLCSNYIRGSNEYTIDEIVDIMEQMNWFFTYTNYSYYCREYDKKKYEQRINNYYYDCRDHYDLDDSNDSNYRKSREIEKQEYNKSKSDYAKRKSLKEWMINGETDFYPKSLKPLVEEIQKELQLNKHNK